MEHRHQTGLLTTNRAFRKAMVRVSSIGRLSIAVLGLTACQQQQADLTSPNEGCVTEEGLPANVLYMASNNPDGQQDILAYRRSTDSTLGPIQLPNNTFSRFPAGGNGVPTPTIRSTTITCIHW